MNTFVSTPIISNVRVGELPAACRLRLKNVSEKASGWKFETRPVGVKEVLQPCGNFSALLASAGGYHWSFSPVFVSVMTYLLCGHMSTTQLTTSHFEKKKLCSTAKSNPC